MDNETVCQYCKEGKAIAWSVIDCSLRTVKIVRLQNDYVLLADELLTGKINYCPMCGRKFE